MFKDKIEKNLIRKVSKKTQQQQQQQQFKSIWVNLLNS
jgi:hypothetical protein